MMHNIMTCQGTTWITSQIFGGCSQSWLIIAVLVFLALVLKRQTEDGILSGVGYNVIGAFVGGLGTCLIIVIVSGSPRWALLGGLIGLAIGGFLLGRFMDTNSDGGDYQ